MRPWLERTNVLYYLRYVCLLSLSLLCHSDARTHTQTHTHTHTHTNTHTHTHQILQATELNLQLTPEDIIKLKDLVAKDDLGKISYVEFANKAVELISSLYQDQPTSDQHWVELATKDRAVAVTYNKQTGEMRFVCVHHLIAQ